MRNRGLIRRHSDPLVDIVNVFDGFMGGAFNTRPFRGSLQFSPVIDTVDKGSYYLVIAEIPGVAKDDISVELEDRMLTIKGEKKAIIEEEDIDYSRRECAYGRFERMVNVPEGTTEKDLKASFKDGVLTVRIDKAEMEFQKKVGIVID